MDSQALERMSVDLEAQFVHWEKLKDMVDQSMDLMLNLRGSGHPGGSRSKVHILLALLLSGIMRWDIRRPQSTFADRFILVGGHTNPLVYAVLAVLNEALIRKAERSGDSRYRVPESETRQLLAGDLLRLRRRDGLPGHAEMAGKTLFFKFNTGPSGHGTPVAAGQALALKRAGCGDVRVFALEGEGGLTPGAVHETQNSAFGLGLDNLYFLVDWNNFGIDDIPIDRVVYGSPAEWFGAHGWRVLGTPKGMEWPEVTRTMLHLVHGENNKGVPNAAYFVTRKGRGYGIYDNKSHGSPHAPMNSEAFWATKKPFTEKYGVEFQGQDLPAPESESERVNQTRLNLERVMSLYDSDPELLDYTADRLIQIAETVPDLRAGLRLSCDANPAADPEIVDYRQYPASLFLKPGEKAANRNALARFGAYVNATARRKYGRPLFIVMSADLADSTNISGFARDWEEQSGYGVYFPSKNPEGVLLPQEITEFSNAGICAGLASTNFAPDPEREYCGFFAAASTYGSFSYLKYGPMRLFSQMTQDSPIKCGKIIWIAGHSGPETADDSRTHFGIFAPGVTELFPKGQVINLYPWEHNEVAVMLSAALQSDVPIIALHLTRPPIEIPDRAKLGIASHFEAARGAYLVRDYRPGLPRMGTLFVQGTSTTLNVTRILPQLDQRQLNVKIVAAVSYELFLRQPESYRTSLVSEAEWIDSTVITNAALRNMHNWLAKKYAMSSDWDDRWRTGGTVDEVLDEARLTPDWILRGIDRFVRDRRARLDLLGKAISQALEG